MPSALDLGKNINFNASESSSNGDPSEIRQLENPGLFKGTWTDTHFMTLLLMWIPGDECHSYKTNVVS